MALLEYSSPEPELGPPRWGGFGDGLLSSFLATVVHGAVSVAITGPVSLIAMEGHSASHGYSTLPWVLGCVVLRQSLEIGVEIGWIAGVALMLTGSTGAGVLWTLLGKDGRWGLSEKGRSYARWALVVAACVPVPLLKGMEVFH